MALFVLRDHGFSISGRFCVFVWIGLVVLCFGWPCSSMYVSPRFEMDDDSSPVEEVNYHLPSPGAAGAFYRSQDFLDQPLFVPSKGRVVRFLLKSAALEPDYRHQRPIFTNKRYTAQAFHAMRG